MTLDRGAAGGPFVPPLNPSQRQREPAIPWRATALVALFGCNLVNVGFLALDERMWAPEFVTGAALLAGALAYVVAVPLIWHDRPVGHKLCLVVIPLASIVVVGDNYSVFGSAPNTATYWLNWAFFALQWPLAGANVMGLGAAAAAARAGTPAPGARREVDHSR